ncbi:MAG TPA: acyl-CoA dehydrogenase, partial [Acidimicrobiaceae bacterium]|nr:acyl-CoA dehydrogenase [Acidimicrobiaceae bacterium]
MGREYRVQTPLQNTDVPVPRTVAMCEDESIIGVPFYLMDFVDGIVYSDTDQVAHLDQAQALAA